VIVSLLGEFPEGNKTHPRVEAQDDRAFEVAVADPFVAPRILAGVQTRVIGEVAAIIIYFRFPLTVTIGLKLGEFRSSSGIIV
jgi:hypothetical protein